MANLGPTNLFSPEIRDKLSEEARSEKKGVEEDDNNNKEDMTNQPVYHSNDFLNLYALMAHEEELTTEEWLIRVLIAIFLFKCLKLTGFFKSVVKEKENGVIEATNGNENVFESEMLTEDELFACKVILRVINICPTNCHDVSEFETPSLDSFNTACNKVSVGASIYPTLALFNHACDPSFMRCNKGNGVICVANRKILKGKCQLIVSDNSIILKKNFAIISINQSFQISFRARD